MLFESNLLITKALYFGWSKVFCNPLKSNISASATNARGFFATTGSGFSSTLTSSFNYFYVDPAPGPPIMIMLDFGTEIGADAPAGYSTGCSFA